MPAGVAEEDNIVSTGEIQSRERAVSQAKETHQLDLDTQGPRRSKKAGEQKQPNSRRVADEEYFLIWNGMLLPFYSYTSCLYRYFICTKHYCHPTGKIRDTNYFWMFELMMMVNYYLLHLVQTKNKYILNVLFQTLGEAGSEAVTGRSDSCRIGAGTVSFLS